MYYTTNGQFRENRLKEKPMSPFQELICCPVCKNNLIPEYGSPDNMPVSYSCNSCNIKYPLIDGITDFMPHTRKKASYAQKAMESESIVEIYESTLWRANNWFSLFTGISLEDEISLVKKVIHIDSVETVLDLGCGPGLYSRSFAETNENSRIIGMDISWPMLKNGAKKAKERGLDNICLLHGDAHHIPLKSQSIDAVCCCAALHIIPSVEHVLKELHRVIKPGGTLCASVFLNNLSPMMRMHSYFAETFGGVCFFPKDTLMERFSSTGFEPQIYHAKGIWMIIGGKKAY